ncbi:MAG: hypothetical protein AAFY84_07275 [Pseudomonadota bacterium]
MPFDRGCVLHAWRPSKQSSIRHEGAITVKRQHYLAAGAFK